MYVDADAADARAEEWMDVLDSHCGCVKGGPDACDLVVGVVRVLTEEQLDAEYADEEEEEEEDDRPKRRRRKTR